MSVMQLNLPDDIESQAEAAGFSCVNDYVQALISRDAAPQKGDVDVPSSRIHDRLLPRDQWKCQLQSLLEVCESTNPDYDDSRESIYPVR